MSQISTQLSFSEKRVLDEFLESTHQARLPGPCVNVITTTLALLGLGLFVSTTGLVLERLDGSALSNLTGFEKGMYASGLLAGTAIMAAGLAYQNYAKKLGDRKRVAEAVAKLYSRS